MIFPLGFFQLWQQVFYTNLPTRLLWRHFNDKWKYVMSAALQLLSNSLKLLLFNGVKGIHLFCDILRHSGRGPSPSFTVFLVFGGFCKSSDGWLAWIFSDRQWIFFGASFAASAGWWVHRCTNRFVVWDSLTGTTLLQSLQIAWVISSGPVAFG